MSCDVALRLGCSDASKSIVATIALPEAGWYATTSWSWSVAPKRPAAKEAVPDVSPGRVMLDSSRRPRCWDRRRRSARCMESEDR